MQRESDESWVGRAAVLAHKGDGRTHPNPPVGACLVKGGRLIGEGWHRRAGGDHAEVAAIRNARRRGNDPKGATLYVSLEPCSRPGRVGACTDAIIAAGIRRVVYGATDPNPRNRGRAKRVLSAAGVACERIAARTAWGTRSPALLCCEEAVKAFAKHQRTGLPYVTVKIAMSLDGRICDDRGGARWISSKESRRFTDDMRTRADAVMVGAETVRRDDPSLLPHGRPNGDLVRVVVSKSGRLPKNAQVFTDGKNPTLVFDSPRKALEALGKAGRLHVVCEGGMKLAVSLAEQGLVDEWLTVLSPVVIGRRRIADAARPFGEKADCICFFDRPPTADAKRRRGR